MREDMRASGVNLVMVRGIGRAGGEKYEYLTLLV